MTILIPLPAAIICARTIRAAAVMAVVLAATIYAGKKSLNIALCRKSFPQTSGAKPKIRNKLFVPIRRVKNPFLVDSLIRVRAEKVALGLNQISGQTLGAKGVEICER